jgi:hypothetical protein
MSVVGREMGGKRAARRERCGKEGGEGVPERVDFAWFSADWRKKRPVFLKEWRCFAAKHSRILEEQEDLVVVAPLARRRVKGSPSWGEEG